MPKKQKKETLIAIAKQHPEPFMMRTKWINYAKENGLPTDTTFLKRFETKLWSECVCKVFGDELEEYVPNPKITVNYSKELLTSIARQHAKHFMVRLRWNNYARENGLPKDTTFLSHFNLKGWSECINQIFGDELEKYVANPQTPISYSKESLTAIAKQHTEPFMSKTRWEEYAKENSLPSSTTFLRQFETGAWSECIYKIFKDEPKELIANIRVRKVRSKEELIFIARQHQHFFTNTTTWRKYSVENRLPLVTKYEEEFGSWQGAHEAIFGKGTVPPPPSSDEKVMAAMKLKREEKLISIAREHANYFTTQQAWDEYAKPNQLPHSSNYYYHFGSWHKAKQAVELPLSISTARRKNINWDKSRLIEIAKKNAEIFTNGKKWDVYARENSLPYSRTYANYFGSWNKAKEEINVSAVTHVRYSTEELIEKALEHKEAFNSLLKWNEYASLHKLPSGSTYKVRFASWNNAKVVIEKEYKKRLEIKQDKK